MKRILFISLIYRNKVKLPAGTDALQKSYGVSQCYAAAVFEEYSVKAAQLCQNGLEGASYLADKVDYCLAVSEYNKQDLIRMGYTCPIDVLPILIPFDDYAKTPSQQVIDRYSDGYTNLIFTGRIAPNKRQEDVIRAFTTIKSFITRNPA